MPRCPTCHRRVGAARICPSDGTRVREAPGSAVEPAAAPEISGYRVLERVGRGSFSSVWTARRECDGKTVALKLSRSSTAASVRRAVREAEALAAVGPPHVPALLERGEHRGCPYLVMDLVAGSPLSRVLESSAETMRLDDVIAMGAAILGCLAAMHDRGLCHRDLKPENIIVDRPGRAVLVDLGLAVAWASDQPVDPGAGTPEYASPEQIRGRVGPASDLYAAGLLLYEMATLRLPFVGDVASVEYAHAHLRPPPPSRFAAVGADLEELILRLLVKDPSARPQDARQVSRQLRGCSAAASPTGSAELAEVERRPVALVVADDRRSLVELADLAETHRGQLAWTRRGTALWLFADSSEPLADAGVLAEELSASGARRVAIHVTVASRCRRGDRHLWAGPELDDVRWRERATGSPVAMTEPARQARAPRSSRASMHGRVHQLRRVRAAIERARDDGVPTLITAVGPCGSGRSRFLDELAATIRDDMPEVQLHRESAPDVDPYEGGELLLDLAVREPVVVLVDDAERADHGALASLEYAVLEHEDAPVVVVAAASERLFELRPSWGERAARHIRLSLGPLPREQARSLLAELLLPVEYPPLSLLDEWIDRAGSLPAELVDLADLLRARGVIQKDGASYVLVPTELEGDGETSVAEFRAAHLVAELPPSLGRLASVCALLRAPFEAAEVECAVAALERAGERDQPDVTLGLFQLEAIGVLDSAQGLYHLATPRLQAGLATALDDSRTAIIHRALVDHWSDRAGDQRTDAALAHHAAALGLRARACSAVLRLAEQAHRCHRPAQAEQHFAQAKALADDDADRYRAHLGRGRALVRLDRLDQARRELDSAAQLARALADPEAEAMAGFELATLLDWAQDFRASAEVGARAVERARGIPGLASRSALARGRSAWRQGRVPEAVEELARAARDAALTGDWDTRVIALLLLGPALVSLGQLGDAEAAFDEVIGLCQQAADRLHLCAAFGNRMFLWSARHDPDAARADLQEAMRLARQVGHPKPERAATYNLAEDLFWSGRDDGEALTLALRSRELASRHIDRPVAEDSLLVARIALVAGEHARASEARRWVLEHVDELDATTAHFLEVVGAALESDLDTLAALAQEPGPVLGDGERLETLYLAARAARQAGDPRFSQLVAAARPLLDPCPIWRERWDELLRLTPP